MATRKTRSTSKPKAKRKATAKSKPAPPAARFTVADPRLIAGTAYVHAWEPRQVASDWRAPQFLGRLWALFGKPVGENDDGFDYVLRDQTVDVVFTAYVGPSGAAFGALPADRDKAQQAARALSRILAKTKPTDCAITNGRHVTFGIRKGKPFYDWDPETVAYDD